MRHYEAPVDEDTTWGYGVALSYRHGGTSICTIARSSLNHGPTDIGPKLVTNLCQYRFFGISTLGTQPDSLNKGGGLDRSPHCAQLALLGLDALNL
jgi:hypothetical protein